MKKAKYIGMIVGVAIGLLMAWMKMDSNSYVTQLWDATPVPFGMIGYAIGALSETESDS
jgi:hypothetical protein